MQAIQIKKNGKKALYTMLAVSALAGVGATAAFSQSNTVHADTTVAPAGPTSIYVMGDFDGVHKSLYAGMYEEPAAGQTMTVKTPVVDGYTANVSTVSFIVGTDMSQTPLYYTKNSTSGTTNNGNSSSSSSNNNSSSTSSTSSSSSSSSTATNNGSTGNDTSASNTSSTSSLSDAKSAAIAKVNGNSNLTAAQKAAAIKNINKATTVSAAKSAASTTKADNGSKNGDVQTGVKSSSVSGIVGILMASMAAMGVAFRKFFA